MHAAAGCRKANGYASCQIFGSKQSKIVAADFNCFSCIHNLFLHIVTFQTLFIATLDVVLAVSAKSGGQRPTYTLRSLKLAFWPKRGQRYNYLFVILSLILS
jgi:hypothetical protein